MATGRVPTTANSPLTAKGDLFTYSTAPARLAVGLDGEQIVADSSTSTGLRYQTNTASGKNAVYNSSFDIWQRGTTFTGTSPYYGADRYCFLRAAAAAGATWTRQSSGLTGFQFSARAQRDSGNTNTNEIRVAAQSLESADSYRFAGKAITFSFYAKVGANFSGTTGTLAVYSGTGSNEQYWVGGFAGLATVVSSSFTPTTSWQRFSGTATVAASATEIAFGIVYNPTGTAGANDWMEVTGLQFEEGSVATAYARQTGSIQGELAACQRYYWRTNQVNGGQYINPAGCASGTITEATIKLPVTMRVTPTTIESSNIAVYDIVGGGSFTGGTITSPSGNNDALVIRYTHGSSVFTSGRIAQLYSNGAGYLGIGAEL